MGEVLGLELRAPPSRFPPSCCCWCGPGLVLLPPAWLVPVLAGCAAQAPREGKAPGGTWLPGEAPLLALSRA